MIENIINSSNLLPFVAIILIAISASFLGSFVLWKKLSYYGDALSHSILLGVVIGNFFQTDQILTLIVFSIIFSLIIQFISRNNYFSKDSIVMITSYGCISLALLFIDDIHEFEEIIFGDVLEINSYQIFLLLTLSLTIIIYTILAFKKILLININKDLAKIDGIKVDFWQLSFLILLSVTVAICVKFVGVFLMTALLILPSAIARIYAKSASKMIFLSLIIAIFSSLFSFEISNLLDSKIQPTLILSLVIVFILSLALSKFLSQKKNKLTIISKCS